MSLKQTHNSAQKIKTLCHNRNKILRKIHQLTEYQECYRIDEAVENIEDIKNDSNRMYQASRFIKSCKKKENLIIKSKNGVTSNTLDCIKILEEHFEKEFAEKEATGTEIPDDIASYSGEVENNIIGTEVENAIKKYWNERSG